MKHYFTAFAVIFAGVVHSAGVNFRDFLSRQNKAESPFLSRAPHSTEQIEVRSSQTHQEEDAPRARHLQPVQNEKTATEPQPPQGTSTAYQRRSLTSLDSQQLLRPALELNASLIDYESRYYVFAKAWKIYSQRSSVGGVGSINSDDGYSSDTEESDPRDYIYERGFMLSSQKSSAGGVGSINSDDGYSSDTSKSSFLREYSCHTTHPQTFAQPTSQSSFGSQLNGISQSEYQETHDTMPTIQPETSDSPCEQKPESLFELLRGESETHPTDSKSTQSTSTKSDQSSKSTRARTTTSLSTSRRVPSSQRISSPPPGTPSSTLTTFSDPSLTYPLSRIGTSTQVSLESSAHRRRAANSSDESRDPLERSHSPKDPAFESLAASVIEHVKLIRTEG
ncbi:MAG: hypothetical protein CNLJKLNK_00096 [Holosporales bacterium]